MKSKLSYIFSQLRNLNREQILVCSLSVRYKMIADKDIVHCSLLIVHLYNQTGSFFKLKKSPDGSIGCFSMPEKCPNGSKGIFSMLEKWPDDSKGVFSMLEKCPNSSKGSFSVLEKCPDDSKKRPSSLHLCKY